MNPTFYDCAFKLILPVCIPFKDGVRIDFSFVYRKGNTERIMYHRALLTDRVKVTHSDSSAVFFSADKSQHRVSLFLYHGKKKIFMKESLLKLLFLSDTGEKTEVLYKFGTSEKGTLLDVSKSAMSDDEKAEFAEIIFKAHDAHNSQSIPAATTISYNERGIRDVHMSVTMANFPGLDKYRNALKIEKAFLAAGGGQKYKVTNGKLISSYKGIYSYIFDLETELYIADDAPVTISASAGINTSGSVLMCEDFQIIIQAESNIGERVASAVISVQPWKLLEAIEDRIHTGIDIKGSKIASELIKTGPSIATDKPIESIPKGQDAVMEKVKTDPVCIVWGPPGTGKTYIMSKAAIEFMKDGKKVLIVSHSNVSVDGVAKQIYEQLLHDKNTEPFKEGKILRYGYVRDEELSHNQYVNSFFYAVTQNPSLNRKLDELIKDYDYIKHTSGLGSQKLIDIKKEINKIRSSIREMEQYYVSRASIVCTTISKVVIDKLFEDKLYDVVMFDEVSMAYVLQIVCAATFCREHFICVGDFMQLAPIAQSRAKEVLCEDIFTYLGINRNGEPYYHPWLVMLDEQRRMHPAISGFSSKYIYRDLLRNHSSVYTKHDKIVGSEICKNQPINLINLAGSYCAAYKNADNSRFNILSAFLCFAAAVKTEQYIDTVSIITPYAAQTRLVRAMVLDYRTHGETFIRCSTVHQFQGSESDVVFFDAVESYPAKRPGYLMGKDFNSIKRLINVAVTRARGKLICTANARFWNNNYEGTTHTLYRLLTYIKQNGCTIQENSNTRLSEFISDLTIEGGPEFYMDPEIFMSVLEKDISNAKQKIVVSLPCGKLNPDYEETIYTWLCAARKRNVRLLIKSNEYAELPEHWKKNAWGTENAVFPLVIIDEKVTWYGVPPAPWKFMDGNSCYNTIVSIAVRMKGEHTAEMIRSLSDLESRENNDQKSALRPKDSSNGMGAEEAGGLSAYISKIRKCPFCRKPLVMTRGKSGAPILWCKDCKKTQLLNPDDINHYMLVNHTTCDKCHAEMTAKVGPYGVYIKCDNGHYINPEDI